MIYQELEVKVDYEAYHCKRDNKKATLTTYLLDNYESFHIKKKRPAVIICPGGGYEEVSEREGEPIAVKFNAMGYHAFVLNYSVSPNVFPCAQLELARSIMMVRENATEWDLDPKRIAVTGFSAGGHLAASIGFLYKEDIILKALHTTKEYIRPDGLILSYPVITSGEFGHQETFHNLLGERFDELRDYVSIEKQITKDTPKTFLWHTLEDGTVPVENSFLLLSKYRECNVPIEFHLFPHGHHGLALATEETAVCEDMCDVIPSCAKWIELVDLWMKNL